MIVPSVAFTCTHLSRVPEYVCSPRKRRCCRSRCKRSCKAHLRSQYAQVLVNALKPTRHRWLLFPCSDIQIAEALGKPVQNGSLLVTVTRMSFHQHTHENLVKSNEQTNLASHWHISTMACSVRRHKRESSAWNRNDRVS